MKATRRRFIAGAGSLLPSSWLAKQGFAATDSAVRPAPNYFDKLGVRSFINAVGPYSSLGGAQMWPEVIEAMDYAVKNKARMADLHDAVGRRIAELTGAEAAMVTAGATCAIIVGTAACMTLGDKEKMERLPNSSDMRNEVIIQRGQRYMYDRSIRAPGARLIEVETEKDIRAAISPATAMMFFLLNRPEDIEVPMDRYVALAREYGIPVMCDAATTVPPVTNIHKTVQAGFDLVCYSGGKGLRGPYSAGLLLGRPDLIEFARQHSSPNHRALGRSMKVAPEEYLGMMVAVETSLRFDEDAEFERQLAIVNGMAADISKLQGVTTRTQVPNAEAREPYIEVHWDKQQYGIDEGQVKQALRDGEPSIEIRALFLSGGRLELTAAMLKDGEADVVARRVKDILRGSA
jgi:D-glucosaminate-6-phosphate ammonia-lyase